ncbi:hypothetical protein QLQ12_45620 [Actinoplanes sp. NEAU-A12]|uniref:SHOCT domain-containing protein n=1 Tax=Actinoplanes sandaracinus TaxID=3045177 RepID=A0ABT6X231_9ACTN|nr:hypothetical protein [Actinoplanes sandaracinus]MDI6105875.1 hypothetical protein [Actinoplanes sandaracinus]
MDVLLVIIVVLLTMRLVGAVALFLVDRDWRRPPTPTADPCLSPVWALPPTPVADPEQSLLRRLRSGEIDQERYRSEIAGIAHRDAAASPLRAPVR